MENIILVSTQVIQNSASIKLIAYVYEYSEFKYFFRLNKYIMLVGIAL